MALDPLVTASLISGGSSLLGGMLSSSPSGHYNKTQRKQAQQNMKLQNEQFYKGIQTKVADARAAGIHPLYALGGQGANVSPVSVIPGQSTETGSALGRGIAEAGKTVGNLMMQDSLIKSQVGANDASAIRDEAAAILALSQVKRAEGEANVVQDFTTGNPLWNLGTLKPKTITPPKLGSKSNPYDATIWVKDEDGKQFKVNNPDINLETGEIIGTYQFITQNWPTISKNLNKGAQPLSGINKAGCDANKKVMQFLRKYFWKP